MKWAAYTITQPKRLRIVIEEYTTRNVMNDEMIMAYDINAYEGENHVDNYAAMNLKSARLLCADKFGIPENAWQEVNE